jgi:hypothetical protein
MRALKIDNGECKGQGKAGALAVFVPTSITSLGVVTPSKSSPSLLQVHFGLFAFSGNFPFNSWANFSCRYYSRCLCICRCCLLGPLLNSLNDQPCKPTILRKPWGKVGPAFHWRTPHFILGCQGTLLKGFERLRARDAIIFHSSCLSLF